LLSVLGASSGLADHLAAHPGDWTVLDGDGDGMSRGPTRPTPQALERQMLVAVGADPDDPPWGVRLGKAAPDASPQRVADLRLAYRRAVLSVAGRDLGEGLAAEDVAAELADGPLAGLRIARLHGRLPPDEKDATMRAFAAGRLDVLVATTVVEVGVDVPNATVMIVLDADRFGVSQLHQLRGRVGRGSAPGLCLLVSEAVEGTPARERLDAVASTLDGFKLAELDLEQRREGDVLGATQSGRRSHLRLLSLLKDSKLIGEARIAALELVEEDPELARHPVLAASIAALVDEERAVYLEKG
jgi:hypothetical protein